MFLNAPLEGNESAKQDDGEISNEDINISMNTEKDRSQASIASSLKAVDIPSFVDSIHVVEEGSGESTGGVRYILKLEYVLLLKNFYISCSIVSKLNFAAFRLDFELTDHL